MAKERGTQLQGLVPRLSFQGKGDWGFLHSPLKHSSFPNSECRPWWAWPSLTSYGGCLPCKILYKNPSQSSFQRVWENTAIWESQGLVKQFLRSVELISGIGGAVVWSTCLMMMGSPLHRLWLEQERASHKGRGPAAPKAGGQNSLHQRDTGPWGRSGLHLMTKCISQWESEEARNRQRQAWCPGSYFPCFRLPGGSYAFIHLKAAEASWIVVASSGRNELISLVILKGKSCLLCTTKREHLYPQAFPIQGCCRL